MGDHSADFVVAFIEPDGVFFLSDCLYDNIYAPTRHYTTTKLFPLLDLLQQFDARLSVTGHEDEIMDRAAFNARCQQMRQMGQLADAHPGDEAGITAAFWTHTQRAPDEDEAELISRFRWRAEDRTPMTTPTPRLNLIATTSRANGDLHLEWDYRNAPGYSNQTRTGLPKSELDEVLAALKADGWALESQCANPTRDAFVETLTFTRPAASAD